MEEAQDVLVSVAMTRPEIPPRFRAGDLVVYREESYTVSFTLTFTDAERHYAVRYEDWQPRMYLVVPESELTRLARATHEAGQKR